MASIDKALARVSAAFSLAVLAGVMAAPFLPGQDTSRAPSLVSRAAGVQPPVKQTNSESPRSPQPAVDASAASESSSAISSVEEDVWTEAEINAGLQECLRLLAPLGAELELAQPVKHGQCGMSAPIDLKGLGTSTRVELRPSVTMNCRLAANLSHWVEAVLQPAAREMLGSPITRIIGASSYACRNIYNSPNLPLSEHATGNAIDIVGFVTADNRTIKVGGEWGPTERDIAEAQKKKTAPTKEADARNKKDHATKDDETMPSIEAAAKKAGAIAKEQLHKAGLKTEDQKQPAGTSTGATVVALKTTEAAFLRRLHHGACSVFGTVLGPEANDAHRDHFHFDMKERASSAVCH